MTEALAFAPPPPAPAPRPVAETTAIRGIRELASKREAAGDAAQRTIVVPMPGTGMMATGVTIALARHLVARGRSVVMVDLAASQPVLSTLAPPDSPGLTDLLAGAAGFARVIHKDPESAAHLVPIGRTAVADRALIGDDRIGVAIRALSQSYDVVLVVADAQGVSADRAARLARLAGWASVVTTNPASAETATAYMMLEDAGIGPVAVMMAETPMASAAAA
jgi:Mrp family chromosome partitioning ATPase